MDRTKQYYTDAALSLLQNGMGVDAVCLGLSRTLKAHGHESLYTRVLSSVTRILESTEPPVRVTVADVDDAKSYAADITAQLATHNIDTSPHIDVDDSLIGGYVIDTKELRIDTSYKKKLQGIYSRSITTNETL